MNESVSMAHLQAIVLLGLVTIFVVTAKPVDIRSRGSKPILVERATGKKVSDADIIKRLLQRRVADAEDAGRMIVHRRAKSSFRFDDEDPLHVLLGSAASKPGYSRRSIGETGTPGIKKTSAVRDLRRPTSRFLEAIGISPYPSMGSSSSDLFDRPYGSSSYSSKYNDDSDETDDDDDDSEYEYYWVECDEDDEDC